MTIVNGYSLVPDPPANIIPFICSSHAVHIGSVSSETVKDKRLFYEWQSRVKYFFKQEGILGAVLITAMIPIEIINRILWLLFTGERKSIVEVKRAFALFLKWILSK